MFTVLLLAFAFGALATWATLARLRRGLEPWSPKMIAALAPPTRPVHAQMWRTLRVLLPESRGKGRGEGGREEQSFSELGLGKIDGALVLSGATGFIGSHILYQLLCVAEELGVSRIVLLVRGRHDADAASRVAALGRKALFDPVRGRFDRLVVPMEADLNVPMDMVKVPAQIGALVSDGTQPTGGYVRCLLHCAADVKFTQTLDEAGLSVITSSLQMADLAAALSSAAERCRLVVVSTIFAVSPAPTATPLPARLATLNGIDPRAIYDNMMSGTAADKWSEATRSAMGYANNYVFAKAVMEPLLKERAAALRVPTILSRPSIVGPAFAVPGSAGTKGGFSARFLSLAKIPTARGRASGLRLRAAACRPSGLGRRSGPVAMSNALHGRWASRRLLVGTSRPVPPCRGWRRSSRHMCSLGSS
jgi:nucleoside-diphosphate-sugar epimerase